ncbi:unannotated protein [freshwater metagenome]|uniref:Unannotated protein n=1 Tax=freshwater metagenome TaxID=449393 RepID=A0A6J7KSU7_9ZZZZ
MPCVVLCTSIPSAEPSTFSAMIRSGRGLPCWAAWITGIRSWTAEIGFVVRRISGFSSTVSMRSWSFAKYGEMKPFSIWTPSAKSTSMRGGICSSTVTTPSVPTRSSAWAMAAPTRPSSFAAIVATCSRPSASETGRALSTSAATTRSTAVSMPRRSSIGLAPSSMVRMPSRTSACASRVAVVVPSPVMSEVLLATSRTSCAPMFL